MPPIQPPVQPPRRARSVLRRWTWLALVLGLLGGLLWAGWYAYNRGFSRKWRDALTAELRRRGLDLTYRKLTLDPVEGLVAEDAHLYLLDARHTPLLYISRAAVDFSLINFMRKKPFLNALDLYGAQLRIPVDMNDPASPRLRLRRFQAKLAILPGEVRLTQAQGDFHGVQVTLSGTLLHPEEFSPGNGPPSAEELAARRQWARTVIDEIQKVRADRAPPRLDIRFQGDLARPGSLRAYAQLEGEALRRGNILLNRLLVHMDYAAGAFHFQQIEAADARGTLTAQGDYNPGTGELRFQLQSGLDLLTLGRDFLDLSALHDFAFHDTPRLRLEGHAGLNLQGSATAQLKPSPASNDVAANGAGALQLTGHLALGHFSYQKFAFDQGETDFSWSGDKWYLRGLRLLRGQQAVNADLLSEPGRAQARLTSTFDPTPFLSLLPAGVQGALARLEFRDPPRVTLTATGPSFTDPGSLRAEGQVTLGHTRYRGAGINRLHGDFAFAGNVVTGRHFVVERDEGNATGDTVVYDLGKHELRLDNVRSNLDPEQAGVWLDPDVYHTIQPFHFHKPPTIVLNGVLTFNGRRESHLVTEVNAPAGMDYVFLKKTLPFQNVAGQIVFTEDRLWLNEVRGGIFNGEAHGGLNLTLGHVGRLNYNATIDLKNVDFARVTKLYFDYDGANGQLAGDYRFSGRGEDAGTLHGTGTLNVEHGNVFAIPFLGPLSSILGAVMPGLGFDEAHQASATFLTDGGKIFTGNLEVKGVGFSLFGGGWLGYMNDAMNFRIRMNTRGLPGAVLSPVSKLFEYSSQGPLNKPVWRPRVLSGSVASEEKTPSIAPPAPPTIAVPPKTK